jgi:hypothetical protein
MPYGLKNEVKHETKSPNTLAYFLGASVMEKKVKKNTMVVSEMK